MSAPDLVKALSREFAAGREFETLLEREGDALLQPGADRLRELSAKKPDLAREVEAATAARNAALTRAGLPQGRAGVERACSDAGSEAKRVFDDLVQCARRVRDLSQRNEILLNMRLQQVGAALNILRRPDETQVYSADGRASSGTGRLTRTTA